ncbi:MAG: zinc ribbon domain-containing protein [Phycisphaerales bacterium]|nr:MAG: zinc ribbon domain-containing protein [Phycisphaerales bacterium]
MAIIQCPGCHADISEYARQCPKCGVNVPEVLAEKRAKDRADELRLEADSLSAREKYEEALIALRELETLVSAPESLRGEIEELEGLRDERVLTRELAAAEQTLSEGDYERAVLHCNAALSLDPQNGLAIEMRQMATTAHRARAARRRVMAAVTVLAVLVIAVAGSGAGVRFYNQSRIQHAREHLNAGRLRMARTEVNGCIALRFLPFLADGQADMLEQIRLREEQENQVQRARSDYQRALHRTSEINTIKRYAGEVWKRIVAEISKAESAAGDHSQAAASYKLARELLPVAGAESRCDATAEAIEREHKASSVAGSGWENAVRERNAALEEFRDGDYREAQRMWEEATAGFEAAGERAREIRAEEDRKKAEANAQAERRRQEQQRRRREEQQRLSQADFKKKAQTVATTISKLGKQSYAYRKAVDAANRDSWATAYEYFELASRFSFSQEFGGRLGFTSKWRLDGNWANEHALQQRLDRGDIVYLLVERTSSSDVDFFLKSPRGDQVRISDEDYEEVDSSGSWKVGAESKGRETYSIKVEVYSSE